MPRTSILTFAFALHACATAEATARDGGDRHRDTAAIGVRALSAAPGVCDPVPSLSQLGAGCHRIVPSNPRATGSDPHGASAAVDGSLCTVWNSGASAPQSIEFDLPPDTDVAGLFATPEMSPSGETTFVVEVQRSAAGSFESLHVVRGELTDEVPAAIVFTRPVRALRMRLRTIESPSWVAWREVFPFACERAIASVPVQQTTVVHDGGTQEPTLEGTLSVVHGHGACRVDADCVPDRCCLPDNCTARANAPHCAGAMCPTMLGPMAWPGTGCLCIHGTCGARIRESVGMGGM